MLQIGKNAKINLKWKVSPYDFSKEKMNIAISKAAKKYKIPKEHVKITPIFITVDEKGNSISLTNDIVTNIQDPVFQLKLFKDYLRINNIDSYNFDLIRKIDSEISSKIDYKVYDKYRRFSIKWIKWSNFLSYGENNFFDFSSLKGLVLLSGQNQSGKTTMAVDLIHFLLFGKTPKVPTLDKIFNKHIPEATTVTVEGCLNIDGEDFVIKRVLTRPALNRRTDRSKTSQKVEYYRIVGENREELTEYIDNQQEENSIQTNKKIKEAIGREDDFDLIMSITESNLDALIDKKDTERGRLLSRWIGLLPLEEKDSLAREHFNQTIKPYLISNQYNSETIKAEIGAFNVSIKQNEQFIKEYTKKNQELDKEINNFEQNRNALLSSKQSIDETLLKVDITTLNRKIEDITELGKKKKSELDGVSNKIKEIGNVDFSVDAYDKLTSQLNNLYGERSKYAEQYKSLKHNIEHLQKSEYCPTCGRKLDNVDNSKQIELLSNQLDEVGIEGKKVSDSITKTNNEIESMKINRDKYNLKNNLTMQHSALEINLEKLRSQIKELLQTKKEYQKNADAIDKNNKLDIQIRNNEVIITDKRNAKENNLAWINQNKAKIEEFKDRIKEREDILEKIKKEEILIKNWKIYLDMVGKNGISKMVLRKTLPIINARLTQILSDVCDFDIEVAINNKNDVMFNLIKDGVVSDLSSGSGFERTCASLALRIVLGQISSIPKNDGIMLDEIWGRVTKENLDNMKKLVSTMLNDFKHVFIVAHVDEVKDWCDTIVNVEKIDNISHISVSKQTAK